MNTFSMKNAAAHLVVLATSIVGIGVTNAHHAVAATPLAVVPQPSGDPTTGRSLYQACTGCHSVDENDVGPRHRGVVGRKAGTVPGYVYSAALRGSGIVWTPANLDRWLSNPQKLVAGAKMYFSIANPQQRADIIAYLAQQH